jgi:hypothetical protein
LEQHVAPSLGPVTIEVASEGSDWASFVKVGKRVPLLNLCLMLAWNPILWQVLRGFVKKGLLPLKSCPCLAGMWNFLREDPIFCKPLSYCRLVVNGIPDCSGSMTSDWVLWW